MTPATVNDAIIRGAGLLVPEQQRAEWLAEWRAELWQAEALRIAVCCGAFRDAWWLRRYGPLPRAYGMLHLEAPAPPPEYHPDYGVPFLASPGRCLLFLAMLAGFALTLAVVLPGHRENKPFLDMLPGFFLGCLMMRVISSFSLGDYPKGSSCRRWLFLIAKFLLMLLISVSVASLHPAIGTIATVGGMFGMRWILEDQRRRCPTCLRLLTNSVRIGQASKMLLEWHGRELVCLRGHGLMHVPEQPSIWRSEQQWMDLDPSWSGLFPSER